MLKKLLLMVSLGFLAIAVVACGNEDSKEGDTVAAIVNEDEILLSEVNLQVDATKLMYEASGINIEEQGEEFLTMLRQHVLDSLIDEQLLVQASESYQVEEAEVEEQFEAIKESYETDEEFQEVLAENNLTEETLKKRIKEQFQIDQYFADNMAEIAVTEEELEEVFAQYSEMSEDELDFEEVKPLLQQSIVEQKKEEEKIRLVEELKANAQIEILI